MPETDARPQMAIPSVDRLLKTDHAMRLIEEFGRLSVTDGIRADLATLRAQMTSGDKAVPSADGILIRVETALKRLMQPSLQPVYNLTGTVLHTNLGRAPLPPEAIEAVAAVAKGASNLEFDIGKGRRGDRDSHVEGRVCRLANAEAATIVNNNAAAVFLTLNALALRKEVIVSRGELIEIGGAFRIPDIMARAGCKLHEVGTTNRTHLRDYEQAIGPRTGLIMKVHTSNYEVQGFTAAVPEKDLATLAREHEVPFVIDLGSGTMTDLSRYGLPHEPTAQEALASGADLVTFSGDKLLGGPQAGIIVGKADLIARIKKNPIKRAMRCDKMTIAALSAVLDLYSDPDRLAMRVPTIRLLARKAPDIMATANRIAPILAGRLGEAYSVDCESCNSQIGSGALPTEQLPSAALVIRSTKTRGGGAALKRLAATLRGLPVPVIGRISDDAVWLDCRCLEAPDEADFIAQLADLMQ
jgi:L-seryl-tRNA(Ser) seleniumtransferase